MCGAMALHAEHTHRLRDRHGMAQPTTCTCSAHTLSHRESDAAITGSHDGSCAPMSEV